MQERNLNMQEHFDLDEKANKFMSSNGLKEIPESWEGDSKFSASFKKSVLKTQGN